MTTQVELPTLESDEPTAFDDVQVVVLRVGDGDYAVPIARVQEIVRVPAITKVPSVAEDVEGVINLRGRVLPVVDLAARLHMGRIDPGREARIVVVEHGAEGVGLLVDGVSEVLRFAGEDIEPPAEAVAGNGESVVRGVAKVAERLILLLDLDRVLEAGIE